MNTDTSEHGIVGEGVISDRYLMRCHLRRRAKLENTHKEHIIN